MAAAKATRPPEASTSNISDESQAIKVAYRALALESATSGDPQNPHGPAAHAFFRDVKADGISNSTISRLVCLPEDKIVEDQQPVTQPVRSASARPA